MNKETIWKIFRTGGTITLGIIKVVVDALKVVLKDEKTN